MIESGSARKYLLYAVGEILLVMVGILLALQVNIWNEKRKSNEHLVAILKSAQINIGEEVDRATIQTNFVRGLRDTIMLARVILEEKESISKAEKIILDKALRSLLIIGTRSINVSELDRLISKLSSSNIDLGILREINQLVGKIEAWNNLANNMQESLMDKQSGIDFEMLRINTNGEVVYEFKKLKTYYYLLEFMRHSWNSKRSAVINYSDIIEYYTLINDKIEMVIKNLEN